MLMCVSVGLQIDSQTVSAETKSSAPQTISKQKNIIHHMDFIISLRLEWEAKLEVQTSKNRP